VYPVFGAGKLREILPKVSRVAILWDETAQTRISVQELEVVARALGIGVHRSGATRVGANTSPARKGNRWLRTALIEAAAGASRAKLLRPSP
jgi:hypothetical protein